MKFNDIANAALAHEREIDSCSIAEWGDDYKVRSMEQILHAAWNAVRDVEDSVRDTTRDFPCATRDAFLSELSRAAHQLFEAFCESGDDDE